MDTFCFVHIMPTETHEISKTLYVPSTQKKFHCRDGTVSYAPSAYTPPPSPTHLYDKGNIYRISFNCVFRSIIDTSIDKSVTGSVLIGLHCVRCRATSFYGKRVKKGKIWILIRRELPVNKHETKIAFSPLWRRRGAAECGQKVESKSQ